MAMRVPHISRFITYGATGFIVGTAAGVWVSSAAVPALLFFGAVGAALTVAFFAQTTRAWCVSVAIVAALFGVQAMVHAVATVDMWQQRAGEELTATAVVRDVRSGAYDARVIAQLEDSRNRVLWHDVKYPAVAPGDRVALTCTLAVPPTDFLPVYPMLLASRRVMAQCDNPRYEIIGRSTDVVTMAYDVRTRLAAPILTMIPAPYAALAVGLLFGGDDLLSQDVQDAFARTGMSHIVAVSGYNVSVIVIAVVNLLIFIGLYRSRATMFAIVAVAAFVALIGFPASGVRAALMGTLVLLAASYGRVAHAYGALALAGAVMLAYNPLLIVYDIGFQLSFLATYGIITIVPIAETATRRISHAFGIVDILLVTVAAQIFVLPVILYHFHTVSFVSLGVNVLVLPLIPFAMLAALAVIVTSTAVPPLGALCAWVAYVILAYIIGVVEYAAGLPWAARDVAHISVWMIVLYYIAVFVMIAVARKMLMRNGI